MDDFSRKHFVTRLIRHGLCDPNALNPSPTPPRIDPSIFDDRERLREETAHYTTRQEVESLLDAMDAQKVSVRTREGVHRRLIALCARWRRAGAWSNEDLEAVLELIESRTA